MTKVTEQAEAMDVSIEISGAQARIENGIKVTAKSDTNGKSEIAVRFEP